MNKAVSKERSRWKKWTDTNEKELRLLFSVLFLQGIVKKPKQEYYWSKHPIFNIEKILFCKKVLFILTLKCM
jgi:hypothetical protein